MKLVGLSLAILATPIACKSIANKVFVWWNGKYQPRPDSKIAFDNFTPK